MCFWSSKRRNFSTVSAVWEVGQTDGNFSRWTDIPYIRAFIWRDGWNIICFMRRFNWIRRFMFIFRQRHCIATKSILWSINSNKVTITLWKEKWRFPVAENPVEGFILPWNYSRNSVCHYDEVMFINKLKCISSNDLMHFGNNSNWMAVLRRMWAMDIKLKLTIKSVSQWQIPQDF